MTKVLRPHGVAAWVYPDKIRSVIRTHIMFEQWPIIVEEGLQSTDINRSVPLEDKTAGFQEG